MPPRVAILAFIAESNTFTRLLTGMDDFRSSQYYLGDQIVPGFQGTGSEIGGAIDAARARGWDADYILAAHAQPGGPVSEAARREITDAALDGLRAGGPYDGVFVALHGAMVTQTDQDGDSQFLRAIRSVIGPDVPVAVSLDLHANIFDQMTDLCQIAVSFQTYPHTDLFQTAQRACALLDDAMAGRIRPRLTVARPPLLVGCDDGRTTDNGPMCRLLADAAMQMTRPGILHAAINAGFTDADVRDAGPSVLITWDAARTDPATAQDAAQTLCDRIWDLRHDWNGPVPLADCIALLRAAQDAPPPPNGTGDGDGDKEGDRAEDSATGGSATGGSGPDDAATPPAGTDGAGDNGKGTNGAGRRATAAGAGPGRGAGPVVVADYADNPGAGAYSDCTALIGAMLAAGIRNAAAGALLDPQAAARLIAAGVGATVTLSIGGRHDPDIGGGPLRVTGQVMAVSDGHFTYAGPMFTGLPACTGPSACLRVADIDIMIVSNRMQMLDANIFRAVGIEPAEKSVVAVKSMNHFKGAFGPMASRIIVTDAGGLCSPDVTRRDYRRLRRPVWPLDKLRHPI